MFCVYCVLVFLPVAVVSAAFYLNFYYLVITELEERKEYCVQTKWNKQQAM